MVVSEVDVAERFVGPLVSFGFNTLGPRNLLGSYVARIKLVGTLLNVALVSFMRH
jgi:hypothetical protein